MWHIYFAINVALSHLFAETLSPWYCLTGTILDNLKTIICVWRVKFKYIFYSKDLCYVFNWVDHFMITVILTIGLFHLAYSWCQIMNLMWSEILRYLNKCHLWNHSFIRIMPRPEYSRRIRSTPWWLIPQLFAFSFVQLQCKQRIEKMQIYLPWSL